MPQYISKLILNGVTQMDVTQDTVAANTLLQGETATKNDGSPVEGAYVPVTPTGNIDLFFSVRCKISAVALCLKFSQLKFYRDLRP